MCTHNSGKHGVSMAKGGGEQVDGIGQNVRVYAGLEGRGDQHSDRLYCSRNVLQSDVSDYTEASICGCCRSGPKRVGSSEMMRWYST